MSAGAAAARVVTSPAQKIRRICRTCVRDGWTPPRAVVACSAESS
jgi:hypothetical protein